MKWLMGAALAAVCAGPVRAQEPPAPVPGVRYQRWEELDADGFGRAIKVRNDYTKPITFTDIVLNRCDNTRQSCGTHQLDKVVQPGKTAVVYRIERLIPSRGYSYNYVLHATFPPDPTNPPPCASANGTPCTLILVIKAEEFHPLVPAETSGGTCGIATVPLLPEGHKVLMMVFGGTGPSATRHVLVRYNSSGVAYEYSDSRVGPGDAKTNITVDLVRETASMRNVPAGGGPPEQFRVNGGAIMTAEALGKPGEMVERITRECGKP